MGGLSNILEKCAGQDWQAKFHMKDNGQNAKKASPNPHFQEFSRIGDDGRGKEERLCDLDQPFAERHVFKDRLVREPAQSLEESPAYKECLIAINDPASRATEVVQI